MPRHGSARGTARGAARTKRNDDDNDDDDDDDDDANDHADDGDNINGSGGAPVAGGRARCQNPTIGPTVRYPTPLYPYFL